MRQEKSFGIVIQSLGSDDLAITFVDEARWAQVCKVTQSGLKYTDDICEWAGYLTDDVGDLPRPEGCPERQGGHLENCVLSDFRNRTSL